MNRFFRRQRYLVDHTLSSLRRHPGRNLALLIVYTLLIFLLASVLLFAGSLKREAALLLRNSPEIILQRQVAGRHSLIPAAYLQSIGRLRGVRKKQGRLWGYFYDPVVRANYTIMVPARDRPAPGSVVIGAGLARERRLGRGEYFTLRSAAGKVFSFQVRDILNPESELVSSDLVLVAEEDFRAFFAIGPEWYTDISLQVANPREVVKVAEKLTELLPDTRPILREEILRTYDAVFSWRQSVVLVLLVGSVLAFLIFAWDRAAGLSGEEKQEIGILKAVGWETGDILRMKFLEGGIVSLVAFLAGYLLAYLHVFYSPVMLFAPVLKGWAILYPAFRPVPALDGLQVATLFFFTVFPYTLATIIPIWRVAIMDPDMVMR